MAGRFPARLVEDLWRIRCSTGWAHGSIWTHRRGFELRVLWDGRAVRSCVHEDLQHVRQDARSLERSLGRDGYDGLAAFDGTAATKVE